VSLLILPDWLVTTPTELPREGWGLRVLDGKVDSVGPHRELVARHPTDEVFAASGKVVMPGFVDAHIHLYGVLAHGIPLLEAPDGFWSFLRDFWWPKVEDALDQEMIGAATDWVCGELLRSGTTTFLDILEAPKAIPEALMVQRAVVESRGIRGILSFEATERISPENGRLGLEENARCIEEGRRRPGLVSGLMSYHTSFTCSPGFIKETFERAAELDVPCHAHCNEGSHEADWCLEHYGKRTIEFYDDLGVLTPRFLASQCVQLSDRERALIAERGVRAAHMPLSNCEVGGGIAPVPEMLDAGVTIGLGSDGYINDFYQVLRGAFLLHKARLRDPGVMPAARVLHMATQGGATALGLSGVGRLDPGCEADLQVVDCVFPTPVTVHNLYDQLVLWRSRRHVSDVMVAGRWRVRKGELLGADLAAMRDRLHHQAERLWSRA
jgi:cytosine/adenosine deaminase-related metal-dependent hydrolase